MNDDEAIRFINSLVKNLQVLCHGSVEFKSKVEVIGHLYLNVDSDTKFDYVVNEKVCKNEESSTTFVSNSFHAAPKKTVAERKKELEEELAKLQTEQAKNQQLIDDRRHNDGRRRKFPFDTSPTNQLAFNRQSPMRRDNFPMSPPQRHRDAATIPKMPRLSFDDIPTYDMNAINSSSASHQPSSSAERSLSDNVYMPSTSLSSSTEKSQTQDTKADIKIDLTSIKQEYISQLDTDNESSCVFDRDKMAADQSSSQLYGSSSNLPPSDINLLSSSPNYSQSNQNFNIRSSIDQSPRHSPGASSLGSPRGSTFVQSPPSMSQGSTQGDGCGSLSARRNRSSFTPAQVKTLEQFFRKEHYPKRELKEHLAKLLNLSEFNVTIWFQNRRQKWKVEQQPANSTFSPHNNSNIRPF